MARQRIGTFSLSLLDMLCCAFGGVIVLSVIFSGMIKTKLASSREPFLFIDATIVGKESTGCSQSAIGNIDLGFRINDNHLGTTEGNLDGNILRQMRSADSEAISRNDNNVNSSKATYYFATQIEDEKIDTFRKVFVEEVIPSHSDFDNKSAFATLLVENIPSLEGKQNEYVASVFLRNKKFVEACSGNAKLKLRFRIYHSGITLGALSRACLSEEGQADKAGDTEWLISTACLKDPKKYVLAEIPILFGAKP